MSMKKTKMSLAEYLKSAQSAVSAEQVMVWRSKEAK